MYGVDPTRPGAQEYYNSIFQLYAEWGVDYVKVDDITRPYRRGEIELIHNAIKIPAGNGTQSFTRTNSCI